MDKGIRICVDAVELLFVSTDSLAADYVLVQVSLQGLEERMVAFFAGDCCVFLLGFHISIMLRFDFNNCWLPFANHGLFNLKVVPTCSVVPFIFKSLIKLFKWISLLLLRPSSLQIGYFS